MSIVAELEVAGETLSPAVRGALVSCMARISALEAENLLLREQVSAHVAQISTLEAQVRDLGVRLGQNSTNSARPPSSDPPGSRPAAKKRRGKAKRKRGGQKGHPGACRTLLSEDRVNHPHDCDPVACGHCGASLTEAPREGEPERRQMVELPPITVEVHEWRAWTKVCPSCKRKTKGALPPEAASSFGPRLVAFAVLMLSRFHLSRRALVAFLSDLLNVPAPALGTTERFVTMARHALHSPWKEVVRWVRRSKLAHADETSWKLRELYRWLWVAAAEGATLFRIGRRSTAARLRLLGSAFRGILITDRWRAYDSHPLGRRQLCWAHLVRDFRALEERAGAALPMGRWGGRECERIFALFGRHRDGEITYPELQHQLCPLQARFRRMLTEGMASEDKKARALAKDLLRLWPALWTFARVEGVPLTNNTAERALRQPVLWRKGSFFSQSGRGLIFVERVLTVVATCTEQGKSPLEFITQAIDAHRKNAPAPRILPTP